MLTIPPIASAVVVGECSFQPLQRKISRTHDGLTHVVEAVDHMPMVVLGQFGVRCESRVHLYHRIETMELMRHARGEHRLIVVPDDGCRQIVIVLRPLDVLEAHADGDELVPCSQCLGLEEVGCVVGGEGLIDLEGCDFGGDWVG